VIGGKAGGLRLVTPTGGSTRPTTDRVRESVFSALDVHLGGFDELAVADLFAGSGALGIEALSRGAHRALFVDASRAAVSAISANLEGTKLAGRTGVVRADAFVFVHGPPPDLAPFDLFLLDPPYEVPDAQLSDLLGALAADGWAAETATAVIERSAARGGPPLPPPWRSGWERRFGDTLVAFADLE